MRQVRLVILEEMQKDYVIGARARGVSEMKILFGHILPKCSITTYHYTGRCYRLVIRRCCSY